MLARGTNTKVFPVVSRASTRSIKVRAFSAIEHGHPVLIIEIFPQCVLICIYTHPPAVSAMVMQYTYFNLLKIYFPYRLDSFFNIIVNSTPLPLIETNQITAK